MNYKFWNTTTNTWIRLNISINFISFLELLHISRVYYGWYFNIENLNVVFPLLFVKMGLQNYKWTEL